ncbi:hypothetical protein ACQ4PT_026434 [Festuca glaucescens]
MTPLCLTWRLQSQNGALSRFLPPRLAARGHTLSWLNGSWLVVFGGCGQQGLLNDVFVLDLDAQHPTWREVASDSPPLPRSWHSSCTLDGSKLVVSGGCAESGVLLSDTFLLDLTKEKPSWKEIPTSWSSRLGHTLSVYGKTKLFMFGGLAKSGSLRLRSSDAYTLDVGEDNPQWRQLATTGFPSVGPPPRLDHVTVSLPCGRIIIFGGSIAGLHSPAELFLLDPAEEKPTWRILNVPGSRRSSRGDTAPVLLVAPGSWFLVDTPGRSGF